jgi:hypothetical protein
MTHAAGAASPTASPHDRKPQSKPQQWRRAGEGAPVTRCVTEPLVVVVRLGAAPTARPTGQDCHGAVGARGVGASYS